MVTPAVLKLILAGIVGFAAVSIFARQSLVDKCSTRYFEQPKDHFAFKPGRPTFKHRVLYNLDSFRKNGPIFFYLGMPLALTESSED